MKKLLLTEFHMAIYIAHYQKDEVSNKLININKPKKNENSIIFFIYHFQTVD